MYILFAGFSPEEQKIIRSWSENRPPEFGEGFSVGNSLQIGRLVQMDKDYLEESELNSLKDFVYYVRETRSLDTEYIEHLKEIRFFYNKKLDCIFSVNIRENDMGMCVELTRIPFKIFFTMVDKDFLTAFLGMEEEGEIISDNEIELVETGFLSRYLICSFIDNETVFLFESIDFKEFRKLFHFIKELGNRLKWKWKEREVSEEDKEEDS